MSLILEALRKSEAERRRGQAPDLRTELPPAPAQRRVSTPAWAWLLLASAVLLAAVWLARAPQGPAPARVDVDVIPSREVATTPVMPTVPRLLPSAVVVRPQTQPAATPPQADKASSPVAKAPEPVASVPRPTPPVAVAASVPGAGSNPLQLSDLTADERKSLPPLKLSMHLWNDDPRQRFVILDGNRLHEGDRVGNGVITAITTDGVLIDWDGRQLKLPIR